MSNLLYTRKAPISKTIVLPLKRYANFAIRTLKENCAKLIGAERMQKIGKISRWVYLNSPFALKLQKELRPNFKIGFAVLAHERPEYLELCLDSLFQTKLYDYDVTFLLQDDGSTNPMVREIIERDRDPQYKIVRSYTPKGENSWGAAFNKAMKKLLELGDFDIIGSCDSDALFHPEWLDKTLKICLWAKKNHRDHRLGPFSSFNSSDYEFHRILGNYTSPEGNYTVKVRMGALNYFYFKEDFLKLGFFEEHKDDETRMTERFEKLKVRNFSTETSYVEHIGHLSVLNEWRPTPVERAVYGMNLVKDGWPDLIEKIDTLGYYKSVKSCLSLGKNVSSEMKLDVIIPAIEKDMDVLPHVIDGIRECLGHPIGSIKIVAPDSKSMKTTCELKGCEFVDETGILPINKQDILYKTGGYDRAGWLFQQLLKLSGEALSSEEYYLVIDADTVPIRSQVFELDGRQLLLLSDEYHKPYFDVYHKLFGSYAQSCLSFVSHTMLFQQEKLSQMKAVLEQKHNDLWFKVIIDNIDKNQISGFSEYETYGQWMLQNYPNEIIREYWFNKTMQRTELDNLSQIKKELAQKYRMISFHDYI